MTVTIAPSPSPGGAAAHARALFALGLPLIGSNLAMTATHITDTLMLGWYSVEALAAVVLGGTFWFVIFLLGSGFGWAVMPMAAEAAGRGDETTLRRVTRMGLWVSLLFAAAVLPLMWFSGPLLRLAGQDPQIAALAQDYLRIAGFGLVPALLTTTLRSTLSALERTRIVLWATVAGAALNVFLNWVFIFGNLGAPELGVRGAALASLGTNALTLLAILAAFGRDPGLRRHDIFVRLWRSDWPAFASVVRLGLPIGLTSLAEVGLFAASALMMGWLGTVPLAAHGIALQIASLTFMYHLGLSQAATVRAGNALGRGDGAHLRQGARVAIGLSMGFAAVTVVLFLALPEPMVGLFLDPAEPQRAAIVATGAALLAVAAAFQVMDAAQVMALGLLRGLQDTTVPMIYTSIAYWLIGMPASYYLGFTLGLGGVGVWMGLVIGLGVAGALLMTRFWRRARAL